MRTARDIANRDLPVRPPTVLIVEDELLVRMVIADYLRLTGEKLGACGTRAECHQHAPIACLSCPYFEPLINAPWETLMVTLIEDQKVETEPRIQQINHNAMAAIQQIITVRDSRMTEAVS